MSPCRAHVPDINRLIMRISTLLVVCVCVCVCVSLTFVTTPDTIIGAFGGLKKKRREREERKLKIICRTIYNSVCRVWVRCLFFWGDCVCNLITLCTGLRVQLYSVCGYGNVFKSSPIRWLQNLPKWHCAKIWTSRVVETHNTHSLTLSGNTHTHTHRHTNTHTGWTCQQLK